MNTPPRPAREEPPTIDVPSQDPPSSTVPPSAGSGTAPTKSRPAVHPALQPGGEFGRYRVERLLGQGGMGAVYLARDGQLNRLVALKVPNLSGGEGSVLRQRLVREARIAAQLSHPNLCPVHDVGEIDGIFFLSMAYVEGQPLSDLLKGGQQLPTRAVVSVVRNLAQAMAIAHKQGIVHRDLKPSNIMITPQKQPVVMDFGLAKQTDEDVRLTRSGALVGTPAYMSPEQVEGDPDNIGPPSDVYSLGVILYELIAGRLPFMGSVGTLMAQILKEPPPPPSQYRPDIDPDLERICLKALAKKPRNRYASMREFAQALDGYLKQNPNAGRTAAAAQVAVPVGPPPKSKPHAKVKVDAVQLFDEMAAQSAMDLSSADRSATRSGARRPRWLTRRGWNALTNALIAGGIGVAVLIAATWAWRALLPKPLPPLSAQGVPTEQEVREMQSVLWRQPDDPQANRVVGGAKALRDGNWADGLAMLRRGDLPRWRDWADADLNARPADAGARGDAWWRQAWAETGPVKARLLWRAAEWYTKALPDAADGRRSRYESRIRQARGKPDLAAWSPILRYDLTKPCPQVRPMTGGGGDYFYDSEGYVMKRSGGDDVLPLIGNQSGAIACEVVGRFRPAQPNLTTTSAEWQVILENPTRELRVVVAIDCRGVLVRWPNEQRPLRPFWALPQPEQFNTVTVVAVSGYVEVYVNGVAAVDPIAVPDSITPATWKLGVSVTHPGSAAVFQSATVWQPANVKPLQERAALVR